MASLLPGPGYWGRIITLGGGATSAPGYIANVTLLDPATVHICQVIDRGQVSFAVTMGHQSQWYRQSEVKGAALPFNTLCPDGAAVALDNVFLQIDRPSPVPPFWRESEVSNLLKPVEDKAKFVGGNASTLIFYGNEEIGGMGRWGDGGMGRWGDGGRGGREVRVVVLAQSLQAVNQTVSPRVGREFNRIAEQVSQGLQDGVGGDRGTTQSRGATFRVMLAFTAMVSRLSTAASIRVPMLQGSLTRVT